jgi:hypothetical protein
MYESPKKVKYICDVSINIINPNKKTDRYFNLKVGRKKTNFQESKVEVIGILANFIINSPKESIPDSTEEKTVIGITNKNAINVETIAMTKNFVSTIGESLELLIIKTVAIKAIIEAINAKINSNSNIRSHN